jgi:hypothetical protein
MREVVSMAVDVWLLRRQRAGYLRVAEDGRDDGLLDATGFSTELMVRAAATVLRAQRRQAFELKRKRGRKYRDESPRV